MKKFLFFASAVAAMLSAGSCQKEALKPASEGDATVKFTIELPQVETKAIAQAENTDIVYYEIWNSDWTKQLYPVNNDELASVSMSNKVATLELTLVSSQTYNFIFWAQNEECGAYDVNELKNVKVDYDVIGAEGNQDKFDAFYAVKTFKVDGAINETVVLYRPFAQLNFGADTMVTDLGDITVDKTYITVDRLASVFNTIKGVGENEVKNVVFEAESIATDEALVTNGQSYTWVAMDYMLMMSDQDVVEVDASFNVKMDSPIEFHVVNVPLKKNYRTNIVGDLFTSGAVLNIIVDPAFNQPDEIVDAGEAVIAVASAAELQEAVAAGRNVVLTQDVTIESQIQIRKNLTLDLNGKTLTAAKAGAEVDAIWVRDNAELVITGNGTINATYDAVFATGTSKVTIENGTFIGVAEAVFAQANAQVIINGGSFKSLEYPGFTLNLKDSARTTASILVNGGSFYQFNPADNAAEGEHTNFVAEGKTVEQNGDWYIVK